MTRTVRILNDEGYPYGQTDLARPAGVTTPHRGERAGGGTRAAFTSIPRVGPEHMAVATGEAEPTILTETLRVHGIEPTPEYQVRYAQAPPDQYRDRTDRLRHPGA
jgi:hypothetical protein